MNIPEGVIAAMLTPFDDEGKIDEKEIRKQVNFLISKGINGLFPVASCGEYTHIDVSERKYQIDIVVDEARGRVDVIPGTGATCYHQSIELANYAKEKGCAGIVLHGPYFFQNTTEVVEGHLRKVAESVDIPIFLYNIPFFANEVTPIIVEKLCSMPNVVGIKDSSGNMVNVMNLIEMTRKVDPDFKVLVGAEEIMLPALLMGGKGCMTATAGILPEFVVGIYNNFNNKNFNLAYNLQFAILPLIREMKSVNFPQGFKEALSLRGIKIGPPKMNYPQKSMMTIADLRSRLEIDMKDLMSKYFPGVPLEYNGEDLVFSQKFEYPCKLENFSDEAIKKYTDCVLCGMCMGDRENTITKTDILGETRMQKVLPDNDNLINKDSKISEDLIIATVKKVLKQYNM